MTQVERARELAEKRTIGKTFPLYDLNVKETNPYVQLVYYVCWNSFGSSSHSCVCVCVFFIRSVVILSEFVCLFNSHFPCASRSFTPINLFRFHFAHIMYFGCFQFIYAVLQLFSTLVRSCPLLDSSLKRRLLSILYSHGAAFVMSWLAYSLDWLLASNGARVYNVQFYEL